MSVYELIRFSVKPMAIQITGLDKKIVTTHLLPFSCITRFSISTTEKNDINKFTLVLKGEVEPIIILCQGNVGQDIFRQMESAWSVWQQPSAA